MTPEGAPEDPIVACGAMAQAHASLALASYMEVVVVTLATLAMPGLLDYSDELEDDEGAP